MTKKKTEALPLDVLDADMLATCLFNDGGFDEATRHREPARVRLSIAAACLAARDAIEEARRQIRQAGPVGLYLSNQIRDVEEDLVTMAENAETIAAVVCNDDE